MSSVRRCASTLALWLALAPAAAACPKTSLGDIEDEVMCPVCGTALAVSSEDQPLAKRQRAFIQRQIGDCKSKDEVKAALVAEFGDEVLALPDDDGFEAAAYVVPAAILLGAAGAVAVGVHRWRRPSGGAGSGTGSSAAADRTYSSKTSQCRASLA